MIIAYIRSLGIFTILLKDSHSKKDDKVSRGNCLGLTCAVNTTLINIHTPFVTVTLQVTASTFADLK